MAPKQIDVAINQLESSDLDACIQGIQKIKNLIIGNRTNKAILVTRDCVSRMVTLLFNSTINDAVKNELLVIIGSLSHGNFKCVERIVQLNAISPIMNQFLKSSNLKLLESAARTLRIIFQNTNDLAVELSSNDCVCIEQLLSVASKSTLSTVEVTLELRITEITVGIVSRIVPSLQRSFSPQGIHSLLHTLINYLDDSYAFYPKLQEAVLDALASIFKDCADARDYLLSLKGLILGLGFDGSKCTHNLCAVDYAIYKNLTNLARSGVLPDQQQLEVSLYVLPALIRLFEDASSFENTAGYGNATIQEKAPLVFAYLVGESEELQKWAKDADAITKLNDIIEATSQVDALLDVNSKQTTDQPQLSVKPRIIHSQLERKRENALLAIAAVCSLREECRKQVIEAKLLPAIVNALSHSNTGIRSAACNCTRSLSRSVKNLRTSLVDSGVALPLVKLLSDESTQVKITASATLCNIVLDFSPMKKTVLENGGVEILVSLINSKENALRLNAVWALKNLLYQADSEIKQKVMGLLGWDGLDVLLNDPHKNIREQAINLLRNFACGKENDIQQVFDGFGGDKLISTLTQMLKDASSDEIILQALYTIVNVVTGRDEHKNFIMNSFEILQRIMQFMNHSKSSIRIAAVWCVINLTWKEDGGVADRVARLRELGIVEKLQQMKEDKDVDVRDRVKTALSHFQPAESSVSGADLVMPLILPPPTDNTTSNQQSTTQSANRDRQTLRQRILEQQFSHDDMMDTQLLTSTERDSLFGFTAFPRQEDFFDEEEDEEDDET